MNRTLDLTVIDQHPVSIIEISGFLAQLEVYKFKSRLESLIAEGRKYLIVDLTGIDFIDSAGLGCLVQLRQECLRHGGHLYIVQPGTQNARSVLNLSSFHKIMQVFESLDEVTAFLEDQFGIRFQTLKGQTKAPLDSRRIPACNESSVNFAQLLKMMEKLDQRLNHFDHRLRRIELALRQQGAETLVDTN